MGTKGGVLIYAKNGINFKPRHDLNTLVYKDKVLESFFIEAINTSGKNHIVGVIYRHPSMAPTTFVNEHLKPLTSRLAAENKNKYIAGDFNLDLLRVKVVLSLYGSDFKSRNMRVYRTLIESLTRYME